tara:strand:+ start:378 stop:491 length:114 start_codon:yes stop_codon:yes gene_type:complete
MPVVAEDVEEVQFLEDQAVLEEVVLVHKVQVVLAQMG